MCVEMINLLPAKIDKANSERWENEWEKIYIK